MYFYLVHLLFFVGGGGGDLPLCPVRYACSKIEAYWFRPARKISHDPSMIHIILSFFYIHVDHAFTLGQCIQTHIYPSLSVVISHSIRCPKYMYQSTCVQLNEANKLIKIIQCCAFSKHALYRNHHYDILRPLWLVCADVWLLIS